MLDSPLAHAGRSNVHSRWPDSGEEQTGAASEQQERSTDASQYGLRHAIVTDLLGRTAYVLYNDSVP